MEMIEAEFIMEDFAERGEEGSGKYLLEVFLIT